MSQRGVFLYSTIDEAEKKIIDPIRSIVPVDIIKIVQKLGIELKEDFLPFDVSGLIRRTESNKIIISYDMTESKYRQRFTIAHELAHYFLGHLDNNQCISENVLLRSNRLSNMEERDANYLAAELLMPMSKIDGLTTQNAFTVQELAKELQVSEQALLIRLGIT